LKLFKRLVYQRGFDSGNAHAKFGNAVFGQRLAFERSDNERKECFLESEEFSRQETCFRRQLSARQELLPRIFSWATAA
jgi:hypothetical protein